MRLDELVPPATRYAVVPIETSAGPAPAGRGLTDDDGRVLVDLLAADVRTTAGRVLEHLDGEADPRSLGWGAAEHVLRRPAEDGSWAPVGALRSTSGSSTVHGEDADYAVELGGDRVGRIVRRAMVWSISTPTGPALVAVPAATGAQRSQERGLRGRLRTALVRTRPASGWHDEPSPRAGTLELVADGRRVGGLHPAGALHARWPSVEVDEPGYGPAAALLGLCRAAFEDAG